MPNPPLNPETERADEATVNAAAQAALDKTLSRRRKTLGERIYNRGVYTGIGLGVNEVGSMIVTDEMQHGLGKAWFERASEWLGKSRFFKDKLAGGKLITAKQSAANSLMWFSLTLVGTALVWPMKALEDRKAKSVTALNHFLDRFGAAKSAEDIAARDEEVERAVSCERKQTWPALIVGRLAGLLTSTSIGYGLGEARTRQASQFTDKWITKAVEATPARGLTKRPRFRRYAELAAPETIGCTATSIVLEIVSKGFAKQWAVFKDPQIHAQALEQQKTALAAALERKPAALYADRVDARGEIPAQIGV